MRVSRLSCAVSSSTTRIFLSSMCLPLSLIPAREFFHAALVANVAGFRLGLQQDKAFVRPLRAIRREVPRIARRSFSVDGFRVGVELDERMGLDGAGCRWGKDRRLGPAKRARVDGVESPDVVERDVADREFPAARVATEDHGPGLGPDHSPDFTSREAFRYRVFTRFASGILLSGPVWREGACANRNVMPPLRPRES